MIKKIFIYLKSDGFVNALKFTLKSVTSMVYNHSLTNIYKTTVGSSEYNGNVDIKEVSLKDAEAMVFPRFELLPFKKWLNNKSHLYVAYIDGQPVGYSWIHYNSYHFAGDYNFSIDGNECWFGPSFVKKEFRGQGIQKALTAYRLSQVKDTTIYTSVSSNNIASNKCMLRSKFELIGTVHITTLFGKEIKTKITPSLSNKIIKQ